MKRRKPFWHEDNPWKDHLVYVPLAELAAASSMIGNKVQTRNHCIVTYTRGDVLTDWNHYGFALDAYVLTGPLITAGIRYGKNPEEYLSPGFLTDKLLKLLIKYREEP